MVRDRHDDDRNGLDPRGYYRSRDQWHLSKGVPVSLFAVALAQAVALIIWGTRIDSRVSTLENNEKYDREVIERRMIALENQLPRIAVIEAKQAEVIKRLDVNAIKLDTLLDRSIAPYQPK